MAFGVQSAILSLKVCSHFDEHDNVTRPHVLSNFLHLIAGDFDVADLEDFGQELGLSAYA